MSEASQDLASAWAALQQAAGRHPLGLAFARALAHQLGEEDPLVLWIAYGLMSDLEEGHGCWTLAEVQGRLTLLWRRAFGLESDAQLDAEGLKGIEHRVRESRSIGELGSDRPLLVDGGRVYLRKMLQAEGWIAQWIDRQLQKGTQPLPDSARAQLPELFSFSQDLSSDLQCIAAVNAWVAPLALLAGGPGTGKTYTVVNYLALAALASDTPPKILLLAPTGKAATRLAQSVQQAKQRLKISEELKSVIPDQGLTIHRALGLGGAHGPRHHRHRPLDADLVVVDETSMVDLMTMAHLLDAIPQHAKVMLVGDAHQLASVQAGTVFGDLCQGAQAWSPSSDYKQLLLDSIEGAAQKDAPKQLRLGDLRVHLQVSRRYDADKGIGKFSRALLCGDREGCLSLLRDPDQVELRWIELAPESAQTAAQAWSPLLGHCEEGYSSYWEARSPKERLVAAGEFQVLCATRAGHYGVEAANAAMWNRFWGHRRAMGESHNSPRAMSIMMTRNDYATGLFNGDVGVIDQSGSGGLRAYFEKDGEDGELLSLSIARLGQYDPAFAMTIHKSQGSEFSEVMVVLGDQPGALLSRELLYTAVTRAKTKVCVVASEAVLRSCIQHRVQRRSGLAQRIS